MDIEGGMWVLKEGCGYIEGGMWVLKGIWALNGDV